LRGYISQTSLTLWQLILALSIFFLIYNGNLKIPSFFCFEKKKNY
jgi:hypothetical protein